MSSPVYTVAPDTLLREVAGVLSRRRVSAVPVVEGERLVGLVSEADLLRRRRLGGRRARDVMSREVETVAPDTPVEEVAALLEERAIRRVPVLDAGRVVGIVSRANLVQALAVKAHSAPPQQPESDPAIRARVLSRLEETPEWATGESNAVVTAGVVHLWGRLAAGEDRAAVRDVVERIPGVRRVEDHRAEVRPRAPEGVRIRKAAERGHSKHGGVEAFHSFSFGNFYDSAHLGYGPLRALNEKRVQPGDGSTSYGLSDIEVVTYMLAGTLGYEDSLDNSRALEAGGVQCLSSGVGVRFMEANPAAVPARLLQLWIEPDTFAQPAQCAYAGFPAARKRGRLQPVVSGDGRDGSLRMRQDAVLYAGLFDGAERARLDAGGRLVYVHVARGSIEVQGRELGAGDGLATAASQVTFENGREAEVLVLELPDQRG